VTSNPPAGQAGVAGAVARLTPFVTVAIAAFVPLAAGLYLVTTTAWTLAERTLLRRLANRRARARESSAAS
jgi:YidC/Oxa1 family membrane protein insertase